MKDDEREIVDCLLSTSDNPYNPFDDFINWYRYDIAKGYNTCSYMARVCESTDLSTREARLAYNQAAEDAVPARIPFRAWRRSAPGWRPAGRFLPRYDIFPGRSP